MIIKSMIVQHVCVSFNKTVSQDYLFKRNCKIEISFPESNDTGGTWRGTRHSDAWTGSAYAVQDAGTGSACTVQESDAWVLGHFTTTGGSRQPVVKLGHDHPDNWGWTLPS